MKYHTKYVTVEAVQWQGFNFDYLKYILCRNIAIISYMRNAVDEVLGITTKSDLLIETKTGTMRASIDDYIVRENDKLSIYKPDVFKTIYEENWNQK